MSWPGQIGNLIRVIFWPVLVFWAALLPGGLPACLGRRVLQFVQLYTDTDAIILNMAMGGGVGCIFQSNWRRLVIRVLCFLLPS